jgi:hypothetical protein
VTIKGFEPLVMLPLAKMIVGLELGSPKITVKSQMLTVELTLYVPDGTPFIFSRRAGDVATSTTDAVVAATGILCGNWNDPHLASSFQAVGVVIGLRNWSTASRRSRPSSSNLNHKDKGNVRSDAPIAEA